MGNYFPNYMKRRSTYRFNLKPKIRYRKGRRYPKHHDEKHLKNTQRKNMHYLHRNA